MLQTHLSVFLGNKADVETKLFINTSQIRTRQQMNTYFWVGASKPSLWNYTLHRLAETSNGYCGKKLVTCSSVGSTELCGDILLCLHGRCREILGDPQIPVVFPGFFVSISATARDNCQRYVPTLPTQPMDTEGTEEAPSCTQALAASVTQAIHPECRSCVQEKAHGSLEGTD